MKKEIGVDPDAKYFKVIDETTGREIRFCTKADDSSGEYEVYENIDGRIVLAADDQGRVILEICRVLKKGRIRLIDTRAPEPQQNNAGRCGFPAL